MDIALHLPKVFLAKANPPPATRVWEFKNFNRQAVIWEATLSTVTVHDYVRDTRNAVKQVCRPNFLRGLALGTVLNVERLPLDATALAEAIDARQKSSTVWQWGLIVSEQPKVVIAVHTWMRVSLTDIFDSALSEYREHGYEVGVFKKDKDALMRFLTRISGEDPPEIEIG